ncbi:MAG: ABC transporter permease [Henriciella sp.]|nr:ABC transporter permease [Henriciella sp.]
MALPEFELIEGDRPQLVLRGDWTISTIGQMDQALHEATAKWGDAGLSAVSAKDLTGLDTAGAYIIDRTMRALSGKTPKLVGAEPAVKTLLAQARDLATRHEDEPNVDVRGHGFVDLLERTGRGAVHLFEEFLETLSFLGATMVSVFRVLVNPARVRWTALVSVMEESGLDAVPIVAFLSFFVGMVVAFIGATSLAELGATIFVVESVGIGLLRELSGVLAAIIVAGRTNSAFTAQIGAMKMRQEIDAMQTLGIDPLRAIVAPRVVGMMIMLPVLTFIAMLAGLAGGIMVSWTTLDISPTVFFNRMQAYVGIEHFWIGMSKAPVFGLMIALIGCRQGLEVGGSVQSLGSHTTKSVVQAIFAVIVIDALFAVLYMQLGI